MKVVLDTNILVSALFWQGREHRLLQRCIKGELKAAISPEILSELTHVMRDYFDASEEEIAEAIDLLMSSFEIVEPRQIIEAVPSDDSDNRILECAVEAKADKIISGDKHLLSMKSYKGIRIVKAIDI
jgi:uncharacterized protein